MSKVVELRVYKGQALTYDINQNITNENQKLTFDYGTIQFPKNIANLRSMGFCVVELKALYLDGNSVDEFEINKQKVSFDSIKTEIENIFNAVPKVELTPEQKKIADLEAKNQELSEKMNQILANQAKQPKPTKAEKPVEETK